MRAEVSDQTVTRDQRTHDKRIGLRQIARVSYMSACDILSSHRTTCCRNSLCGTCDPFCFRSLFLILKANRPSACPNFQTCVCTTDPRVLEGSIVRPEERWLLRPSVMKSL